MIAELRQVPDTGPGRASKDSILGLDPPEHTRLRRLVAGAVTASRVEARRPRVIRIVDDLLARSRPADLVDTFSWPVPVQVIGELLGVPADDRHTFHAWSDQILGDLTSDPAAIEAAFGRLLADPASVPQAVEELTRFVQLGAGRRRPAPGPPSRTSSSAGSRSRPVRRSSRPWRPPTGTRCRSRDRTTST